MGNTPSYSQWCHTKECRNGACHHATMYIPIFGLPSHIQAFQLSSALPYTQDPLFTSFILSPFFEKIPQKLTNFEFVKQYQINPERHLENYKPRTVITTTTSVTVSAIITTKTKTRTITTAPPSNLPPGQPPTSPTSPTSTLPSPTNSTQSQLSSLPILSVALSSAQPQPPPSTTGTSEPHYEGAPMRMSPYSNHYTDGNRSIAFEGFYWRPQRIELSTSVFDILPKKKTKSFTQNDKNGQNNFPTIKDHSGIVGTDKDIDGGNQTQAIVDGNSSNNHNETDFDYPTHVPFFKLGLPTISLNPRVSPTDAAILWEPNFSSQTDLDKALPFRSLGNRNDWGKFQYEFDKKSIYQGLGGDGKKTEFEIFSSIKQYPRPSLIAVRGLNGYDFEYISGIPHVSTIPAHHTSTIIIIDVICESSHLILQHFIQQTIALIHRGCIIPLTNVNLYILQLNADKLDAKVIQDDEIFNCLSQLFDQSQIHLCPHSLHPLYQPAPVITPPFSLTTVYTAYPILSIDGLTKFLEPLWEDVYRKVFELHQDGHWDRLVSESTRNKKTFLIPSHHFPITSYISTYNHHGFNSTLLLSKCLNDAMNGLEYEFHHTDEISILRKLFFQSFYQSLYQRAMNYNYAIIYTKGYTNSNSSNNNDKTQDNLIQTPTLNTSLQIEESQIALDLLNAVEDPYQVLFGTSDQDWNDPMNYLPHLERHHFQCIDKLKNDDQNPSSENDRKDFQHIINSLFKPLPFSRKFEADTFNLSINLPLEYQHPLSRDIVKKFERKGKQGTNEKPSRKRKQQAQKEIEQAFDEIIKMRSKFIKLVPKGQIYQSRYKYDDGMIEKKNEDVQKISQNKLIPLHNDLISIGLPSQYEFESFIMWSEMAIYADPHHVINRGYFYEPHVQYEIMKAVDLLVESSSSSSSSHPPQSQPKDSNDNNLNTQKLTISDSKPSLPTPIQILNHLLVPQTFPASLKTPPTPLDYLQLTLPRHITLNFPSDVPKHKKDYIDVIQSIAVGEEKIVSKSLPYVFLEGLTQVSSLEPFVAHNGTISLFKAPPLFREIHGINAKGLTFMNSRVELVIGEDGSNDAVGEIDDFDNERGNTKNQNDPANVDKTEHFTTPALKIGITYTHRPISSAESLKPPSVFHPGPLSEQQLGSCTHPLIKSMPFLPMAWLNGIIIIPFLLYNKETSDILRESPSTDDPQNIKTKNRDEIDHELPIFLQRPIGTPPWSIATNNNHGDNDIDDHNTDYNSPHITETKSTNTTTGMTQILSKAGSYPPDFIPPPIPPFPLNVRQRPDIHQGLVHNWVQNDHAKQVLMQSPSTSPFTLPLPPVPLTPSTKGRSYLPSNLDKLLPNPISFERYNPSSPSSNGVLSDPLFCSSLASYSCPITFIILIINPICYDQIVLSDIESSEKDGNTSSGPTTRSRPNSTFEPITPLQYRYYQEYIPPLYKRQLVENIFASIPLGASQKKLEQLLSVEVHTPESLSKVYKRLEEQAVYTRLKMYHDVIKRKDSM